MRDLQGKTVWITGASSGIGAALARAFAQRGARLVLSARRVERLEALRDTLAVPGIELLPLDLAAPDTLAERAARALSLTGGVDVMVHNAGVGQRGSALDTDLAVDRRLMEVNYFGPLALTKALLPSMRARGRGDFIVMSSVLGLISAKQRTGYAAAKHALHGFFDGLRAELHGTDLGVLLVCPGHVTTEFSESALEADGRRHAVVDGATRSGLSPELCAERVLAAYDARRAQVTVAGWEHLAVALERISPALYRVAVARAKG